MNGVQIGLLILYCTVVGLTMIGYATKRFWLRAVNKSLLMPSLAALYAALAPDPSLWILLALLCGWVGDVLLLGTKNWNRNGGLLSFALGHIFYITGMLLGRFSWTPFLLLCLGWEALMICLLWRTAISRGTRFYKIPGICYSVLLSGISAAALYLVCTFWFTWEYCLCFIGTVSFIASDCALARRVFGVQSRDSDVFVMATYIFAQTALAIGFALHGGI